MARVSKFAILTNILLASGILAVPSSSLEARLARLRKSRQSNPTNNTPEMDYNGGWSGAAVTESEGTFTTVTGTFNIPRLGGPGPDNSATAWVGIDGPVCRAAILQAGVDLVVSNGNVVYAAWVEWYPDPAYYFPAFNISAGDEIKSTVTASSKNSGSVVIENLTTRKRVTKEVSSSTPLCGQTAEWIVEDFMQDIPLADFGTIRFTNATASGPGGSRYTPNDANIIFNLQQDNGTILTDVSVSNDTVFIKRI